MNNLAYTSQDPAKVGGKVEEKIRAEVGSSAPLQYELEMGAAERATVRSFLGDIAAGLVGGADQELFRLNFRLPQPRPIQLAVSVNRQGVGSHVGLLLYTAQLLRPLAGEVALEDPKLMGQSKFAGEAATAGRLNANGDLLKRANSLARTESQSGGLTLKITRCCKVMPHEGGALLVVTTLPRPTKLGFSAAVDVKEFWALADMVEAAL